MEFHHHSICDIIAIFASNVLLYLFFRPCSISLYPRFVEGFLYAFNFASLGGKGVDLVGGSWEDR